MEKKSNSKYFKDIIPICIVLVIFASFLTHLFLSTLVQRQYTANFESLNDNIDKLVMEGIDMSTQADKLSFRLACQSEPNIGNTEMVALDNKGNVVADSYRSAFFICSDKNEKSKSYFCRMDVGDIEGLESYNTIDMLGRTYYLLSLSDIEYIYSLDTEFYYFTVNDAYIGDDVAYPGTIDVITDGQERSICNTISYRPDGYALMQLVDRDAYNLHFVMVGTNENIRSGEYWKDEELQSTGDRAFELVTTGGWNPFGGTVNSYGKRAFTDSAGEEYSIYFKSYFELGKLRLYVIVIDISVIIITLIAGAIARRLNNKR